MVTKVCTPVCMRWLPPLKRIVPPPLAPKVKVLLLSTVRLFPPTEDWNSKVEPLLMLKTMVLTAATSATLVKRRVPPLIVVVPPYCGTPILMSSRPAPLLVSAPVPVTAEAIVRVVEAATSKAPPPAASVTPRLALSDVVPVVCRMPWVEAAPKVSWPATKEAGTAPRLDSEATCSVPLPTVRIPVKALLLSPETVQVPTPSLTSGSEPVTWPPITPAPAPPMTRARVPVPVKVMAPVMFSRPASEVRRVR